MHDTIYGKRGKHLTSIWEEGHIGPDEVSSLDPKHNMGHTRKERSSNTRGTQPSKSEPWVVEVIFPIRSKSFNKMNYLPGMQFDLDSIMQRLVLFGGLNEVRWYKTNNFIQQYTDSKGLLNHSGGGCLLAN